MPRLMPQDDKCDVFNIAGPGNYQFSGVRFDHLGATEYTLVTLLVDKTGSVLKFADQLLQMVKTLVESCRKHPRSENLLIRYVLFDQDYYEVHGFKPLSDIDANAYDPIAPQGMTALYDASFNVIGATLDYAELLVKEDYDCNGAVYIVTDGSDNQSRLYPHHIKEKIETAIRSEDSIESMITVLVGLKDPNEPDAQWADHVSKKLEQFKNEAELTQYIDVGDATPDKLAKLANFISESISSQSQALGKGAPSQTLTF